MLPGAFALAFWLLCDSLSTHRSMTLRVVGVVCLLVLMLILAIFAWLLPASPSERRPVADAALRTHAWCRRLYAFLAVVTVTAFLMLAVLAGPLSVWMAPAVALSLGSIAMAVALGARLRSVRAEESQTVLLAYLATMTGENGEPRGRLAGIESQQ